MTPSTFNYRETKTTYHHRIQLEDGPGSLTNISSDTKEYVFEFETTYLISIEEDYGKGRKVFTQGGWVGYTYMLELFNQETQRWDLVGFIPTYEENDYDDE